MLLNIQSIRNKSDELHIFLESNNYPHILLITHSIHGGTMILINEKFSQNYHFTNFDKVNFLIVEKEFEFSIIYHKNQNLYFICLYRPPQSDENIFVDRLEELLTSFLLMQILC